VKLAGGWFGLLVKQHLDDLACLSVDVMADMLHEPLLVSMCGTSPFCGVCMLVVYAKRLMLH
jgi:hypothetical protein